MYARGRNVGGCKAGRAITADVAKASAHSVALVASLLVVVMCGVTATGANSATVNDPSVLAGSCANCHGTDGRSSGSIPSIAGLPYPVIKAKLEAFKINPAPDATVMPRLMRAYDTEQIEQLARYFSDIKPGGQR